MHSFSTSSSVTCLSQHNSTLLSPIKSSLITLVYYSFVYSISGAFILCSLLLSFTFYANAYLFNLTVNVLMQMHHSLKHYLVQTSTQLFGDDDGDDDGGDDSNTYNNISNLPYCVLSKTVTLESNNQLVTGNWPVQLYSLIWFRIFQESLLYTRAYLDNRVVKTKSSEFQTLHSNGRDGVKNKCVVWWHISSVLIWILLGQQKWEKDS